MPEPHSGAPTGLAQLVAACAFTLVCACTQAAVSSFSFAALGDTPYNSEEESQFVGLVASMNREPLAFAIHVGDMKSGSSPCSDDTYLQRRDWFALSHHPFVFVPGDNDWTDCWRSFGARRDPLERLGRLREIFFGTGESLGQRPLALARQGMKPGEAHFPEHARWIHGDVVFATLNVPGGDNNRSRMPDEARTRDAAVIQWIRDAFAVARERKLPGVVLAMQANPWRPSGGARPAYAQMLEAIATESSKYRGAVLVINGDTHRHRFDQPLTDASGKTVSNVRRLEVYGSPVMNWVRVTVTAENGTVRYDIAPGT